MDDVDYLRALHTNPGARISYIIFQPERGETTGTPHLQGFIAFEIRKPRSTVQNLLGRGHGVNLIVPNGTPQDNKRYCSKDGPGGFDATAGFDRHERGDLPDPLQPGKRTDLLELKTKLDNGEHLWTIAKENEELYSTVLRNSKSLSTYEHYTAGARDSPTALFIYEGSPGTFKSYSAFKWPNHYVLEHGNSGTWFDGYEPNLHDTVVIDEFHGGMMPYTMLKKLCDRYPMSVETKGGRVRFRAKRIVITSNIQPKNWYPKYPVDALERRITGWFTHSITEAEIHGLPAGTTLIHLKTGKWGYHPCNKFIRPVDTQPGPLEGRLGRLDIDALRHILPIPDVDEHDLFSDVSA